jgi:hypothetical protein
MTNQPYRTVIQDSGDPEYTKRLLVGTATTGLVRIEWVGARYGNIIPVNWSMVTFQHFIDSYIPLRYQVDDAQNMIAKEAVEKGYEWCLLLEHDVIIPPDCFIRINEYMRKADIPIVSGLYYTRSRPSEPLLFRGRGNSFFDKWQMGDRVWVDGIPTGIVLIHGSILKAMWAESPEYAVRGAITRRIFETPRKLWYDPETDSGSILSGTSDLWWCDRIMKENFFTKAGWPKYQKKKYPFLVDTQLFCRHINQDGEQFP